MAAVDKINTIRDEIIDFTVLSDIIEVGFDDYILEVDLSDMEGMEINKDNLAKIIYEKYRG